MKLKASEDIREYTFKGVLKKGVPKSSQKSRRISVIELIY